MTVRESVILAYRVHDFQMTGGPGWIDADRYNIDAKAGGAASFSQDYVALQYRKCTLLRDRFQLAIHRETKERPVYELTVAKGGPKLQPPKCVRREPGDFTVAPGKYCGLMRGSLASGRLEASGASMAFLADYLSSMLTRTVADKTGISGEFDSSSALLRIRRPFRPLMPRRVPGPDFFTAIEEQLGLKLEVGQRPGRDAGHR